MRGMNWHVAPGEVVLVELDEGAAVVAEAAHALYRRGPVTWSMQAAGGEGPGAGALGSALGRPSASRRVCRPPPAWWPRPTQSDCVPPSMRASKRS